MSSELHLSEVEKTLLYISEASDRAARARRVLERDRGERHLIEALKGAEERLAAEHRVLMQASFFAVPTSQDQLAV